MEGRGGGGTYMIEYLLRVRDILAPETFEKLFCEERHFRHPEHIFVVV